MLNVNNTFNFKNFLQFSVQNDTFWEYRNLDHSYQFEKIDILWWRDVAFRNIEAPLYACALYLLTVFALEKFMEKRTAFDLRSPLIWWNTALGFFSVLGFIRTFQGLLRRYNIFELEGIYRSICVRDYPEPVDAFWTVAFAISKLVHFGDTIFLVLRKRPLQKTHWYHHITTLTVVWVTVPFKEPLGRLFIIMNNFVLSAIYPYYAMKTAGFSIPKIVTKFIATAEVLQMVAGFLLNAVTLVINAMGFECFRAPFSVGAFFVVYGTFAVLFGRLCFDEFQVTSKSKKDAHVKES